MPNTRHPTVLVVDDHLDTCRMLRTNPDTRDVPVVMYSAMSDAETETARTAMFVVKGRLTFDEMRGVVERHVRRSDA